MNAEEKEAYVREIEAAVARIYNAVSKEMRGEAVPPEALGVFVCGPSNANGYLGLCIGILRERSGPRKREADFVAALKLFCEIHSGARLAPAEGEALTDQRLADFVSLAEVDGETEALKQQGHGFALRAVLELIALRKAAS